jgi:hypothetical protein
VGINLAPIIAGALLGALAATPAPAGAVLLCSPYGCVSSPYFRPPIVPVGPPVIWRASPTPGRPLPYPPLGPDEPPPAYPLAPAQPPGLRPTPAPPYPPLGNPRQWQQPPQAEALPPPQAAPSPREQQEQHAIESDIMAFCDVHQGEAFCGRLHHWLRDHPRR